MINKQFFLTDELRQIEAQRGYIFLNVVSAPLEGHQYAGLAVLHSAVNKEFHCEKRFAAPRSAADERGTSGRQASIGDFSKPGMPVRDFGK